MEVAARSISINGKEYVLASEFKTSLSKDVRIVILQRGWIYVGRYVKIDETEHILENAKCIRIWGTTKGLGQIVSGPIDGKTVLDDAGTVRFHPATVVATLDCEEKEWAKHL